MKKKKRALGKRPTVASMLFGWFLMKLYELHCLNMIKMDLSEIRSMETCCNT